MKLKLIFSCLALFSALHIATGQDKIITNQHDTILCRILLISQTHINYEQMEDNQYAVGKFIPIEQVLAYYRNSQSQKINPNYKRDRRFSRPTKPWVIGLQAGGTSLLASTSGAENEMQDAGISQSQAEDYFKQLKHGFHVSVDVHYLIKDFFGLGLKYSLFTSSSDMEFLVRNNDYYLPIYFSLGEKEKLYVNYIGPSVIFQQWLDKKHKFRLVEELSVGYTHYREEIRIDPYLSTLTSGNSINYNALLEGSSWGADAGLSFEYYPVSWLSIGANANLFSATIKEIDMSTENRTESVELNKKDYENLFRLDYAVGVRFHF
ncbi:MAG: hypothetical protein LBU22_12700 [Dysgonamonadaceae bacterium]|jgi:hypothetical protein|nr:hypothetical protein [Dysgonamonadaceae bacterium]